MDSGFRRNDEPGKPRSGMVQQAVMKLQTDWYGGCAEPGREVRQAEERRRKIHAVTEFPASHTHTDVPLSCTHRYSGESRKPFQTISSYKSRHVGLSSSISSSFHTPPPVFDALLTHNRAPHRFVALIPNQRVDTVTLRETFRRTVLMLPDPTEKVGRNADIERSATLIGENVDARLLHCSADSHCFRLLITDAAISVLCSHRHYFHRHSGESRNPS